MEITKVQQDKMDEILDEFDFAKMQRVMEFLDWKWATIGHVPMQGDIRRAVREELRKLTIKNNAKQNKGAEWEEEYFSGGLSIRHFGGIDDKGPWENYECQFVAEYWRTEEDF